MTLLKYIEWFGCTALVFIIIEMLQIPFRRKKHTAAFAILFVVKMIAAIVIAYCSMAFCSRFVWNLGYLPGALYIVLFCDALADLAALVMSCLRKGLQTKSIMLVSLIITVIFTVYGTVTYSHHFRIR